MRILSVDSSSRCVSWKARMTILLFSVWLIIVHLSRYDVLLAGADNPFIFRVATFMFALSFGLLCLWLWFTSFSLGVGLCWCASTIASLVSGCVVFPCVAGLLRAGGCVWGISQCGSYFRSYCLTARQTLVILLFLPLSPNDGPFGKYGTMFRFKDLPRSPLE